MSKYHPKSGPQRQSISPNSDEHEYKRRAIAAEAIVELQHRNIRSIYEATHEISTHIQEANSRLEAYEAETQQLEADMAAIKDQKESLAKELKVCVGQQKEERKKLNASQQYINRLEADLAELMSKASNTKGMRTELQTTTRWRDQAREKRKREKKELDKAQAQYEAREMQLNAIVAAHYSTNGANQSDYGVKDAVNAIDDFHETLLTRVSVSRWTMHTRELLSVAGTELRRLNTATR